MRSNKKFVMAPARTSPNEMPIEFLTVLTIMLSVASGSQKWDISLIINGQYPTKIENKLCFCTTLNNAICMAKWMLIKWVFTHRRCRRRHARCGSKASSNKKLLQRIKHCTGDWAGITGITAVSWQQQTDNSLKDCLIQAPSLVKGYTGSSMFKFSVPWPLRLVPHRDECSDCS